VTNVQQPASFSGRKGKGAGVICQLVPKEFLGEKIRDFRVGEKGWKAYQKAGMPIRPPG